MRAQLNVAWRLLRLLNDLATLETWRAMMIVVGSKLVSRRNVLRSAAAVVGGGVALDSLVLEPHRLEVTRHNVGVPRLPRHLDGFAIAQVTEAHLTSLGRVEDAIVRVVREEGVQLVALTGDMPHAECPF